MSLSNNVYDTSQLLGVIVDDDAMEPPSNYWLNLCFPSTIQFETEEVDFSRIQENRKIAPLVVPTAQGVPIYSAAEERGSVKPAYVKPKDAVSASRVIKRAAGFGELNSRTPMTPQQRYLAIVADILKQHRYAIERRWEWMACEAIVKGSVTLEDDNYPRKVVDFQRDAGHTVTLTSGNFWGDSGVSILELVETWRKTMRRAKHGGVANRLTVGVDAWDVMRKDSEIKELLKTDYAPTQKNGLDINLGLMEGLDVEWVGRLSGTLDVYVYSDYYQLADGTVTDFISPKQAVLTGPSVNGVRCFGAIQDVEASFQPLQIFPKMWNEKDPSATFVMSQSAPLMVPMSPNATFAATVVG
jgi:hypothetical protein